MTDTPPLAPIGPRAIPGCPAVDRWNGTARSRIAPASRNHPLACPARRPAHCLHPAAPPIAVPRRSRMPPARACRTPPPRRTGQRKIAGHDAATRLPPFLCGGRVDRPPPNFAIKSPENRAITTP